MTFYAVCEFVWEGRCYSPGHIISSSRREVTGKLDVVPHMSSLNRHVTHAGVFETAEEARAALIAQGVSEEEISGPYDERDIPLSPGEDD